MFENDFLFYNNVTCDVFSKKKFNYSFCIDFDVVFIFIFDKCYRRCYLNQSNYFMSNNKKLKCTEIEFDFVIFNKCVDIAIRLQTIDKNYVEMNIRTHILFQLQCDIIINVSTLKLNNITLFWSSNFLHCKNQKISIKVTFNIISKFKKEFRSSSIFITKFSVFFFIQRRIKFIIRQVSMYVIKIVVFQFDENINISIRHRFLSTKKSYFFEFIVRFNLTIEQMITIIRTVVIDIQKAMSINNFDFNLFKIRKKKLFNHIFTFFKNAKFTSINFAFANVFVEKIIIEFDMLYIFQFSNDTTFNKTNISNYWNLNYQTRVQKIFDCHNNFFRNELNKFNDDIEISIFFKNEIDVLNLKQNFYSFIVRNRKITNEVLNFLLKQNRIQKISLNVFFVVVFSTFVVWKNEKFRVIINFRKVNTRFYFDVYLLFRQNIILNALNEFVIFFFVDLTKEFFQQNTRQQNW